MAIMKSKVQSMLKKIWQAVISLVLIIVAVVVASCGGGNIASISPSEPLSLASVEQDPLIRLALHPPEAVRADPTTPEGQAILDRFPLTPKSLTDPDNPNLYVVSIQPDDGDSRCVQINDRDIGGVKVNRRVYQDTDIDVKMFSGFTISYMTSQTGEGGICYTNLDPEAGGCDNGNFIEKAVVSRFLPDGEAALQEEVGATAMIYPALITRYPQTLVEQENGLSATGAQPPFGQLVGRIEYFENEDFGAKRYFRVGSQLDLDNLDSVHIPSFGDDPDLFFFPNDPPETYKKISLVQPVDLYLCPNSIVERDPHTGSYPVEVYADDPCLDPLFETFSEIRSEYGYQSASEEDVKFILDSILTSAKVLDVNDDAQIAYMIASAMLETEFFSKLIEPVTDKTSYTGRCHEGTKAKWRGRGLPHLTYRMNYAYFTQRLRQDHIRDSQGNEVDLLADPNQTTDPVIGAYILVLFLKEGVRVRDTGTADGSIASCEEYILDQDNLKPLSQYVTDQAQNYYRARDILNPGENLFGWTTETSQGSILRFEFVGIMTDKIRQTFGECRE